MAGSGDGESAITSRTSFQERKITCFLILFRFRCGSGSGSFSSVCLFCWSLWLCVCVSVGYMVPHLHHHLVGSGSSGLALVHKSSQPGDEDCCLGCRLEPAGN